MQEAHVYPKPILGKVDTVTDNMPNRNESTFDILLLEARVDIFTLTYIPRDISSGL